MKIFQFIFNERQLLFQMLPSILNRGFIDPIMIDWNRIFQVQNLVEPTRRHENCLATFLRNDEISGF